ncbi:MAG TPA: GxxExxY protein [Longimicrobium sp.]|nr:GxxExxY protein [Longimicrobium sp.]
MNQITAAIVDTAYRLHSRVGPGLTEAFYESVMLQALTKRGLRVEKQKAIPFEWEGVRIEEACRLDLLVEGRVVVELKSVEKLHPVHHKQVLTYLRLLDLPIGLLINFGAGSLKDGIHRILNHRTPIATAVVEHGPSDLVIARRASAGSLRANSVDSVDSV